MSSSVKISELNVILTIANSDYLPLVQSSSGTTYRATFTELGAWMSANATASWAVNSISAISASYATHASQSNSSSVAVTASFAITASYLLSSGSSGLLASCSHALFADSSSYAFFAISASYALSASYAVTASYAISSSFANSASVAVSASSAGTSSWAYSIVGGLSGVVPVGGIIDWPSQTVPDATWAVCSGSLVATASYPVLFTVIGYTFGGSDSLMGLPDYRKRTSVGAIYSSGVGQLTKMSGSIGNTGGGESIAYHWHSIFHPDQGIFADGSTRNDDMAFFWHKPFFFNYYRQLSATQAPPNASGALGAVYGMSGPDTSNVYQPIGYLPISADGTLQNINCSTYGLVDPIPFGLTGSALNGDLMFPYIVMQKIMKLM